MSDQDAQDINQMMSATADSMIKPPKKSKFLWIVLLCVVVGVGLGVVVYQQSLKPAVRPSPSPRPTVVATPKPSPVVPQTNVVQSLDNTITFPKSGKLRIYTDLNNIQMIISIVIAGQTNTITLPSKATNATAPMNYGDATFDVTAGSTGKITAYLNSTSGPIMRGWIAPFDSQQKECGIQGGSTSNNEHHLYVVKTLLAGESIFAYQCWEDDDVPGEFNDIYMIWTYVPGSTTTTSPSPAGSVGASSSPVSTASTSVSPSPSPSPSRSPSPSPSPNSASGSTSTPTSTPSPRVTMPDTSEGTPVTGIFEVTVGTISVGLILLLLGLFGLLVF